MRRIRRTTWVCAIFVLCIAEFQSAQKSRAVDEPTTSVSSGSGADQTGSPLDFKPRKPAELRKAVSEALRAAAVAKEPSERDKTTRELMLIYLELEQDQNLSHDERLEMHTVVRSRLQSIEKSLRAEIARDHPHKANAKAGAKAKAVESTPQTTDVTVLAQQIAAPLVAPAAPGAGRNAAANRLAVNGGVIGRLQPPDFGQDLVDLIHNVISPRTWDVNGGPGSVVYFRNFRALVVRAPSEVQNQVGDVLGQLRK